ncbi:MAG TPA: S9 family peptidase, partial [Bacteroidia bacterium]|nr:S9 family peptidase [Bacteroidia bacterium]
MKNASLFFIGAAFLLASCGGNDASGNKSAFNYPKTRKVDTVDTYFGVKVPDPYRWLEDDNSDSTKKWVDEENALTQDYLAKIPFRDKIRKRLTEIWNFEKMSAPYKKGKRYFYSKNDGVQNQSVLYYKDDLNGEGKMLLDPNTLSKDGTVSLGSWDVSHDGKYLAYGLNKAGSDWVDFYVKDIASGKDLTDHIRWSKFSNAAWKDNGFYYGRFEEPKSSTYSAENKFQKLYYHKIGDAQDKDQLIYKDDQHPDRSFGAQVTDDQKWLIIYTTETTSGNGLMVKDLTKPNSEFVSIIDNFKNDYGVLDIRDGKMIVRTNNGASNFRLVSIDIAHPEESAWKNIIPEDKNMLEGVTIAGDKFIAHYLVDVKSKLCIFDKDGKNE